jgi:hypothetical protein
LINYWLYINQVGIKMRKKVSIRPSVYVPLDNRITIALHVKDHAAPKITAPKNLKL